MSTHATLLQKLQDWYCRECNGDWEHSYGLKIETLDNPGWLVTVDLTQTAWEHLDVPRRVVETTGEDWIQTEVSRSQFVGSGDPKKLEEILTIFFQLVG